MLLAYVIGTCTLCAPQTLMISLEFITSRESVCQFSAVAGFEFLINPADLFENPFLKFARAYSFLIQRRLYAYCANGLKNSIRDSQLQSCQSCWYGFLSFGALYYSHQFPRLAVSILTVQFATVRVSGSLRRYTMKLMLQRAYNCLPANGLREIGLQQY